MILSTVRVGRQSTKANYKNKQQWAPDAMGRPKPKKGRWNSQLQIHYNEAAEDRNGARFHPSPTAKALDPPHQGIKMLTRGTVTITKCVSATTM
jgi:hypothetical protein